MADETFLSLPLLVGGLAFAFLILLLLQIRVRAGLQKQMDQQRAQARHAEKEVQKLNKQLLEVRSVVVGFRVKRSLSNKM